MVGFTVLKGKSRSILSYEKLLDTMQSIAAENAPSAGGDPSWLARISLF